MPGIVKRACLVAEDSSFRALWYVFFLIEIDTCGVCCHFFRIQSDVCIFHSRTALPIVRILISFLNNNVRIIMLRDDHRRSSEVKKERKTMVGAGMKKNVGTAMLVQRARASESRSSRRSE